MARPELSLVIPIYNEEEVLPQLDARLKELLVLLKIDTEVVFVNDGSKDRSMELLRKIAAHEPRYKVLGFSRNFGHQRAITCGMDKSRGRAVVVMDADLQDPPEVILQMVEKWHDGYDVVYGRRRSRVGESYFKLLTAKWFYRLFAAMIPIEVPLDTGDFRLMSRRVVQTMKGLRETHRFVRGLVAWVGFKQTAVEYDRAARFAGETKYPLRKMLAFAMDGIASFSIQPLRLATYIGALTGAASVTAGIAAVISKFAGIFTVPGWTTTVVLVSFLFSVQFFMIGVLGEYVGRIYEQVKRRPLYIVSERINFARARVERVSTRDLDIETPVIPSKPPASMPPLPKPAPLPLPSIPSFTPTPSTPPAQTESGSPPAVKTSGLQSAFRSGGSSSFKSAPPAAAPTKPAAKFPSSSAMPAAKPLLGATPKAPAVSSDADAPPPSVAPKFPAPTARASGTMAATRTSGSMSAAKDGSRTSVPPPAVTPKDGTPLSAPPPAVAPKNQTGASAPPPAVSLKDRLSASSPPPVVAPKSTSAAPPAVAPKSVSATPPNVSPKATTQTDALTPKAPRVSTSLAAAKDVTRPSQPPPSVAPKERVSQPPPSVAPKDASRVSQPPPNVAPKERASTSLFAAKDASRVSQPPPSVAPKHPSGSMRAATPSNAPPKNPSGSMRAVTPSNAPPKNPSGSMRAATQSNAPNPSTPAKAAPRVSTAPKNPSSPPMKAAPPSLTPPEPKKPIPPTAVKVGPSMAPEPPVAPSPETARDLFGSSDSSPPPNVAPTKTGTLLGFPLKGPDSKE